MSKYDKLKKQKEFAFNQAHEETANLFTVAAESRRVANVAHNAGEIITDLDRKFSSATKLNGKDIAFLFFATALQCIRWILMPERGASQRSIEREQRPEHKLRLDIIENNEPPASPEPTGDSPTWQNLLLSPAPYLADLSSVEPPKSKLASLLPPKDEDRDIADAWGTDPIFGWIFGTLNILSSTVTTRDMRTFAVSQDNVDALPLFLLTPDALTVEPDTTISLPGLFKTCYELFQSDPKLLLAAIAKQASQALDTSAFGFTIPPICGLTTEELTEKSQTAYMQARDIKSRFEQIASAGNADFSATIQRDLSGAFDMLDEVRSMGYFIEETIDEVQGKLDEEDVAPEVQELFENAQASIGKITDILSKPQELLAASGAPILSWVMMLSMTF